MPMAIALSVSECRRRRRGSRPLRWTGVPNTCPLRQGSAVRESRAPVQARRSPLYEIAVPSCPSGVSRSEGNPLAQLQGRGEDRPVRRLAQVVEKSLRIPDWRRLPSYGRSADAPLVAYELRARPQIIESTSDRVNMEFTTVLSYHIW